MNDDPQEELGPAAKAVREALFGRLSDAQIRAQQRHTEQGSDGAAMLDNELNRRNRERAATKGWFGRALRRFFGG